MKANSCTPYKALSSEEMQVRMKNLHDQLRNIQKKHDRVKVQLAALVEKQGISVDGHLNTDLKTILEQEGRQAMERGDCTPFQRLFWQQQMQAASKKDARGIRWHPLMVRWCIYLRYLSQGAYETLRQSKCIALPSQRTLRDYTHHLKPCSGFSGGVDDQLRIAAKLGTCEEREKYVLLLLDEMYVKQDLVYDKSTGQLIGFTNLGELNSHLLAMEKCVTSADPGESESTQTSQSGHSSKAIEPQLASTMMVFMVKGLMTRLQFPYAHFPCRDVTADLLFDPFWEAIFRLERLGFKVFLYISIIIIHTLVHIQGNGCNL